MAKLRAAKAYRRVKRAYTRHSRLKRLSYVKGAPYSKLVQHDMGILTKDTKTFDYELQMIATRPIQIRDNALESARQTAVRWLELNAKDCYRLKVKAVPHQIIREKPQATGAGADRFKQGMTLSFGNPAGHAARVFPGKVIFSFYIDKDKLAIAQEAARKANTKLPLKCYINIVEQKK